MKRKILKKRFVFLTFFGSCQLTDQLAPMAAADERGGGRGKGAKRSRCFILWNSFRCETLAGLPVQVQKMQHARAVASPALSAVVAEQSPDESVLEWTLGQISLPPSSPHMSPSMDSGEEMRLEDLHTAFLCGPKATLNATPTDSTRKQEDEAQRQRLEELKAHIPACLSNVLAVAPAAVTGSHMCLNHICPLLCNTLLFVERASFRRLLQSISD